MPEIEDRKWIPYGNVVKDNWSNAAYVLSDKAMRFFIVMTNNEGILSPIDGILCRFYKEGQNIKRCYAKPNFAMQNVIFDSKSSGCSKNKYYNLIGVNEDNYGR